MSTRKERRKTHDENGCEIVDNTPVVMPVGFHRPPSLREQMMALLRSEQWRMAMEQRGQESFEEADDFDVGDDFDPSSPYEQNFDHDEQIRALDQALKSRKGSKGRFKEETHQEVAAHSNATGNRPSGASPDGKSPKE